MTKEKIIIDTNLWISFLISNNFNIILNLIENNNLTLLYSNQLIGEIARVTSAPKFNKYFDKVAIDLIFEIFEEVGVKITTNSEIDICRDVKDNFLLNLAVDGKADYLITGDKDLLILEQIENTKIITMNEFKTLN
jgi:putative PIN family toxin of toxin-antitoxin system